jgi:quinol monooxygenase YgiN
MEATMTTLMTAHVKGDPTDLVRAYDDVDEEVMVPRPSGLFSHVMVSTTDGFTVVEVWESQEAALSHLTDERFARLLGAAGIPEPEISFETVHNHRQVGQIGY